MSYGNLKLAELAIRKTLKAVGEIDTDLSSTKGNSIFPGFDSWNPNASQIVDDFNVLRRPLGAIEVNQAERLDHHAKSLAEFRTTLAFKADHADMQGFASDTARTL